MQVALSVFYTSGTLNFVPPRPTSLVSGGLCPGMLCGFWMAVLQPTQNWLQLSLRTAVQNNDFKGQSKPIPLAESRQVRIAFHLQELQWHVQKMPRRNNSWPNSHVHPEGGILRKRQGNEREPRKSKSGSLPSSSCGRLFLSVVPIALSPDRTGSGDFSAKHQTCTQLWVPIPVTQYVILEKRRTVPPGPAFQRRCSLKGGGKPQSLLQRRSPGTAAHPPQGAVSSPSLGYISTGKVARTGP